MPNRSRSSRRSAPARPARPSSNRTRASVSVCSVSSRWASRSPSTSVHRRLNARNLLTSSSSAMAGDDSGRCPLPRSVELSLERARSTWHRRDVPVAGDRGRAGKSPVEASPTRTTPPCARSGAPSSDRAARRRPPSSARRAPQGEAAHVAPHCSSSPWGGQREDWGDGASQSAGSGSPRPDVASDVRTGQVDERLRHSRMANVGEHRSELETASSEAQPIRLGRSAESDRLRPGRAATRGRAPRPPRAARGRPPPTAT